MPWIHYTIFKITLTTNKKHYIFIFKEIKSMAKIKQTPGTALSALLKKYNLNYNRLAKAIGLSSAMVRLIARDENPVSAAVAFRLAAFFKMKPEFWLSLQTEYDLAKTVADKKLAKALKDIPTVDKATFERKKKAKKTTKAAKPAGKKGRTAKAKKTAKAAPKKTTVKAKKPTTVKKTTKAKAPAKKAAPKKAAKAPAKKPAKPAAVKPAQAPKKAAPAKPAVVKPAPAKPAPVVKPVSAPVVKPAVPPAQPASQPAPASQPVPPPAAHSETPNNEPKV
jgi:addiction module HigA family antidote